MLFGISFDQIADFMSEPYFWIPMILLFVALIALFIYLRKRGSAED